MSKTKHITIKNKVATYNEADGRIVCKNGSYEAEFAFDEEWSLYKNKTARFTVLQDKKFRSVDVGFSGNVCPIPPVVNTPFVKIGVYVKDEIQTTTPAIIGCDESILCGDTESALSVDEVTEINGCILTWMEEHMPEDGKSAYQEAVELGFEGTEEEWLASLKGEVGPQGPTGEQGPQGHSGVYILGEGQTLQDVPEDMDVVIDPNGDGNDIPELMAVLRYTPQELTEDEKAQARTNIAAASSDEVATIKKAQEEFAAEVTQFAGNVEEAFDAVGEHNRNTAQAIEDANKRITALEAYTEAHETDYSNEQVDTLVEGVSKDLANYKKEHAEDYTNEQIDEMLEGVDVEGVLKYTEQELSDEQKTQARKNIGAPSSADLAGCVKKFSSASDYERAYVQLASGTASNRPVSRAIIDGSMSIPLRDNTSQNFHVGDPTKPTHVVNSQYLENKIAGVLKYTPQTLTDEQKAQARTNIGAASASDTKEALNLARTSLSGDLKWSGSTNGRHTIVLGEDGDVQQLLVHVTDEVPYLSLAEEGVSISASVLNFNAPETAPIIIPNIPMVVTVDGTYLLGYFEDSDNIRDMAFAIVPNDVPLSEEEYLKKGVYLAGTFIVADGISVPFYYVSSLHIPGFSFATATGGEGGSLDEAKAYTDAEIAEAKTYTDEAILNVGEAATTYIDTEIVKVKTYTDDAIANAIGAAISASY